MSDPFQIAGRIGVVPVIAIERIDRAVPLADVLYRSGLPTAEITFRTEATVELLARLSGQWPEFLLGAGTILTPEAERLAVHCGATYELAPGLDPAIVKVAEEASLIFAPRIMISSDISRSGEGLTTHEVLPGHAGRPSMMIEISAILAGLGLRFISTGGIELKIIRDWLPPLQIAAVVGTWIATTKDMFKGDWDGMAAFARAAVTRAKELRHDLRPLRPAHAAFYRRDDVQEQHHEGLSGLG